MAVNGLSPRSSLSEIGSREVRVSPLQRLSAGLTGIQVVPRILFALKSMDFGAFLHSEGLNMRTVQSVKEIIYNMDVLDSYLNCKCESEYSFALNLIKRGTCFIAVKSGEQYRFYPSRFIGYANNNMDSHLNNEYKDGKETNPAISEVLGKKLGYNSDLEKAYREYCRNLGFIPNEKGSFGIERKYWDFG